MTSVDSSQPWPARLLRIAAAVLIGAAITVWVTPLNALGRNLVPVGCGSPASPVLDPLSDFVCRDLVSAEKSLAVALGIAAAVLLLLSEVVVQRLRGRAWLPGVVVASVVAVPVFVLAAATLSTTIASSGADGTLIRCGTPLAPAMDRISQGMCGQLAARDKSLAIGAMALSLLVTLGGGYVASGMAAKQGPGVEPASTDPEPEPSSDPPIVPPGSSAHDVAPTQGEDTWERRS